MVTRLIIITAAFFASILVVFNILGAFLLQAPARLEEKNLVRKTEWWLESFRNHALRDAGRLEAIQNSTLPRNYPTNTEIFSTNSQVALKSSNRTIVDTQPREMPRKVLLIHVGKTGGETVRHTLKITCQMRRNPAEQKACRDSFKAKSTGSNQSATVESLLSKHTIGTLHCDLLLPKYSLDQATTLLWTLRNPLDRVVSWFRYMNPANCRPDEDYHSTACNTNRTIESHHRRERKEKKSKGSQWSLKFFKCFSTINQFARALTAPSLQLGSENTNTEQQGRTPFELSRNNCTQLAWRTILAQGSSSSGHVYFNHKHYWEATIAKRPNLEVWVLRTEYLWEDMLHLEHIFLRDHQRNFSPIDSQYHLTERRNVTHGSERHVHRQQLTSESLQKLCWALKDEINIYRNLLSQATNLGEADKSNSLRTVADQCGHFLNRPF